jgi:arylsulfatase A-like enzyme
MSPLADRYASPQERPDPPNVVLIALDDMGFADLGCYGSEIETPHIDGLAREGLRYRNFHVTALCSPTRACLLTGRNAHAVGMGFLAQSPTAHPGYSARIPSSAGTLPRLLRDAGYSTFAVGKWHLIPGGEDTAAGPFDRWPLGLGFERFYGFLGGATNQWTPDLVSDNGFVEQPSSPEEGYHLTEDLASRAIRFIQDQQQSQAERPFFLYFAPGAMHYPLHVGQDWVEPYGHRFDDGWEMLRRRTFARQRESGLVPEGTVATERPPWVAAWEDLSADEQRLYARQMEVYAGFLTHTDAQIGRLLEFLARIGTLENTIVMLISDNGASPDGGPHGFHDHGFNRINDVAPMLERIDELGGFRAFNHYAWGWAWASSTPFRLWKHYAWLGGVRAPLVVRWPGGVPADQNGRVRDQFGHAIDLMPTILDAAGVTVPEVLDGVSQRPLDGESLLPTLTDPSHPSPRTTQYFEVAGSRAIYHEGWKATTDHVADWPADRSLIDGSHDLDADRWSLFDLSQDYSEAVDLAADHPDRLRQLVELWWHEAGRNGVLPVIDSHRDRLEATTRARTAARRRYTYLPGGGPISTPSLADGFRISADVEISDAEELEGIVCAQGNWHFGWAWYVMEGRLIATFNFGGTLHQVAADAAVTSGRRELGVAYERDSDDLGTVRMTVDREEVAVAQVTFNPYELLLASRFRRLLIGRDSGFPVCDDYQPPYSFTGRIHRFVLEPSLPAAVPESAAGFEDD